MTQEEHSDYSAYGGNPFLHNTGGPRSRTREEKATSSLLTQLPSLAGASENIGLLLPPEPIDPEVWLLQIVREQGYKNWEEAEKILLLPSVKMMVFEEDYTLPYPDTDTSILRAALILAKCNTYCYLPEGPVLFTRGRLQRTIRIVQLNIKEFYGME